MNIIIDCEDFGDKHYEDGPYESALSSHKAIELHSKLFSPSFEFVRHFFKTLETDYQLHSGFLQLYQSATFKLIIVMQSWIEDAINERLYKESKTFAFEDNLIDRIGALELFSLDEKKWKRYTKKMSDYLWLPKASEKWVRKFHKECIEAWSLIQVSEKNSTIHGIIWSAKELPTFLQIYDRRITYFFEPEEAIQEKLKIMELLCYNGFREVMTNDVLSNKEKAWNHLYTVTQFAKFIMQSTFSRDYEYILRFCCEGLLKIYYNGDSCKYDDCFTEIINSGDKQDKSLKIRSTLKKTLEIIYECLYKNMTPYISTWFYHNYEKRFTFREHKLWDQWLDALEKDNDIVKSKHYLLKLEKEHGAFFRWKFNMYSIQFHELYNIIVADKALQASSIWKSEKNDNLIEEIKQLFHNWNVLILEHYPQNEVHEKIENIAVHAKQIEELWNIQIQIQKI